MLDSRSFSVYDFDQYRAYLSEVLGKRRTGTRSELAKFIGCPASHVSQVLHGKTHLTLEQGEATSRFLGLSPREGQYFLNLINHERAGTLELKAFYAGILRSSRETQMSVSGRLHSERQLPHNAEAKYYSSWLYLAIHLAVQLPQVKTRADLIAYLGISAESADEALDFLAKNGVVQMSGEGLIAGTFNNFLSKDSPHLNNHHVNWRAKGMEKILLRREENLHYSSAFTVSREGVSRIKQNILELIEANVSVVRDSQDEEVYVFTTDLFRI